MVIPTPPELPVRSPPEPMADKPNTHLGVALPLIHEIRRANRALTPASS